MWHLHVMKEKSEALVSENELCVEMGGEIDRNHRAYIEVETQ